MSIITWLATGLLLGSLAVPAPLQGTEWPDGPAAARVQAFLAALNSEGKDGLERYIREELAASALREKPAEVRLADGLAMRARFGHLTPFAVQPAGPHAVDVVVRSAGLDAWLGLHASVDPAPPHGLLGIRGESIDPPFDVRVEVPAFVDAHPKVVFDEGHHETHRIDGTYAELARALRDDGFDVSSRAAVFDAAGLAGVSVLVIANALGADPEHADEASVSRPAFAPDEVAAVKAHVEAGGSLLLLADHRPWGASVAELAGAFGVAMGSGFTSDPQHARPTDPHHLAFTREAGLLGRHAILDGRDESERVERVVTFTGQSLAGPAGATALLVLSPSARDADAQDGKSARPPAGRSQGLALAVGQGRVVVLGESGLLRRTGLADPTCDDLQFVLNTFHWLARLDSTQAR